MAKTRGPLYSMSARGTIGKTLIFQKGLGATRTKRYRKPNQPDSAAQLLIRSFISMAVSRWHYISQEYKNDWQTFVDGKRLVMSGYNYFISQYVTSMREGITPEDTPYPPAPPVLPDPISWWKFDEGVGTNTADAVDGNDGTLVNVTWQTPGKVGPHAITFGDFKRVDITENTNYKPVNQLTLMAWVKIIDTASQMVICLDYRANGSWSYPYFSYRLGINNHRHLSAVTIGGVLYYPPSDIDLVVGVWAHIALTFDGLKQRTYVNGVLDKEWDTVGDIDYGASKAVGIGSRGEYVQGEYMHGDIDEPKIYDVVLTDDQILYYYNQTK